MSGADQLRRSAAVLKGQLMALAKQAPKIARAAVSAGLSTLSKSAEAASPGSIKNEVGWFVRQDGSRAWGRAGLMQYPDKEDKGKKPHGAFLTRGTKYITARHFIERALQRSIVPAGRAMRRAAASRINRVLKQR